MNHRPVSMNELFYDLIFAYAISNLTGILESAFGTQLSILSASVYLLCFVVMINSWMYQTVYTNRYGQSGITGSVLLYLQDAILLFLASTLQPHLKAVFVPFATALGGLSLLLFVEYLTSYLQEKHVEDRQLIRSFLLMTGIRTALILLGTLFPVEQGVWISISGVLLGWILPAFFQNSMKKRPVDFSHLSERLSLLVIVMFGEMIISLASCFTLETLSIYSLLAFALSIVLFQSYTAVYTRFHQSQQKALTGVKAIYLHYPILIGLNLMTVSISRLSEDLSQLESFISVLYIGLLLFYSGLYGCLVYLERTDRKMRRQVWLCLPVFLVLWVLSCLSASPLRTAVLALVGTALQYAVLYRSLVWQDQKRYF